VAVLAGVSVPYYTRLERGEMHGVSESVLEALRLLGSWAATNQQPDSANVSDTA
jgi:hypothetical protein